MHSNAMQSVIDYVLVCFYFFSEAQENTTETSFYVYSVYLKVKHLSYSVNRRHTRSASDYHLIQNTAPVTV